MAIITARKIAKIATLAPTSPGVGLTTFDLGQGHLGRSIHPFLQLAHFFMTQPVFGEHPHQGIAAVTYMFEDSEGTFLNKDSLGDRSFIRPGDLHWTQAGNGVRHDEAPIEPGKVCHGLQIFVDLVPEDKRADAKALHLNAADIPVYTSPNGSRTRVVMGQANGLVSPLAIANKIRFLDVIVPANQTIDHEIAANESAFMLVINGSATIDDQTIQVNQAVLFAQPGNRLAIKAGTDSVQYILGITENE